MRHDLWAAEREPTISHTNKRIQTGYGETISSPSHHFPVGGAKPAPPQKKRFPSHTIFFFKLQTSKSQLIPAPDITHKCNPTADPITTSMIKKKFPRKIINLCGYDVCRKFHRNCGSHFLENPNDKKKKSPSKNRNCGHPLMTSNLKLLE